GGGFLVPPRIAQRLDRDVDADAVAKTETISHRFCDAIDGHGHALDDMPFDSFGHHFPGERRHAQRRGGGFWWPRSAWNRHPDFGRILRGETMKAQGGYETDHSSRR